MHIESFFDPKTATVTYVVSDPSTQECAIIDSVHDYDPETEKLTTHSADKVINYIKQHNLKTVWILETHIHADHLTASHYLKDRLHAKTAIGEHIKSVLQYWRPKFNGGAEMPADGSQFDVLLKEGETFNIGNIAVKVIHTPGHTPDSISYLIGDAVFVGDAIFMPYVGTGRADFPGGDADALYHSIQKILALPDATRIFTCHDYPPAGKEPMWESTVALQKQKNVMINEGVSEAEFVTARKERDAKLAPPKLLMSSLKANLQGGYSG